MRTAMREKEEMQERLSERTQKADRLVEKWSKKKGIGDGLQEAFEKHPEKVRGLAIVMENQEKHLARLTETQISNAFQTTPENVMRIIRLGYPNSVRGEIFLEWAMETARDSIYYLKPVYAGTARGATAEAVTHESNAYRYATEIEEEDAESGSGNGPWAATLDNPPLRPFTVKCLADNEIVAVDDGAGGWVGADVAAGSINYTNGAITITFTAGTPTAVVFQYFYDSEVEAQWADLGEVELRLQDYQFRAKPFPLGVSWSKMTELLLGTTLDIDAEEALIRGAADELKKSLDYWACRLGYRTAMGNNAVTFDADFAGAGADSEVAHAQSITRKIDEAGDVIYAALNRGGVTVMYGGASAVNYLKLHSRFSDTGRQPKVGVYKVGELDGMGIYKAPAAIVPTDEIVCVYKNENVPEDVSIAFGSLVPLYQTQTLEFKNLYKESGLAHFGDAKVLQSSYCVRLQLENL